MGKGKKDVAKNYLKIHEQHTLNVRELTSLYSKAVNGGKDLSFHPPNKKKTGKLTKKEVIAKIKKERQEEEYKKWETCFKCGGMKNYDGEMFKKCEGCCDECGSSDICSKWKHKDKLCVNCCECDDCIEECIEECDRCGYEDVLICMSNGCINEY
jgi:hypothetical protein